MLQPNHPYSYVQCAQSISIYHDLPHQTHIQYPTDLTTLHSFSILQCHTTHPPYHHPLRSLQSPHILHLHCPSLTTIHHHPLYTCSNLSFQLQRSPSVQTT